MYSTDAILVPRWLCEGRPHCPPSMMDYIPFYLDGHVIGGQLLFEDKPCGIALLLGSSNAQHHQLLQSLIILILNQSALQH